MAAMLATANSISATNTSIIHAHLYRPKLCTHRRRVKLPLHATSRPSPQQSSNSPVSVELPLEVTTDVAAGGGEKFDWYAQWYPVALVCDLEKWVPRGLKVMGMDVVVWWDQNENAWKVFDDMCPHRLAPLSEGRIDRWGRLQCSYHGWCFDGSGHCQLIPQAPPDGPPVHTNKRAWVAAYPTIVHHGIVWFWPNSDPKYKDILEKKKPPFIPELDDPSFAKVVGSRDIRYGYDLLVENLLDPAHLPYAHSALTQSQPYAEKRDEEGGRPVDFVLNKLEIDGFDSRWDFGNVHFIAPCTISLPTKVKPSEDDQANGVGASSSSSCSATTTQKPSSTDKKMSLIFFCVPVAPGSSRIIWASPKNYDVWIEKIIPRWIFHMGTNLILDSDLCILHAQGSRMKEVDPGDWQKAYFVPTESDALVVGFRRWLNKYAGGEVDWRGKYDGALLPTPSSIEQLMDRYWTHVVNCPSCKRAYKGLNVLETILQVLVVGLIGIAAATKQGIMSTPTRARLAILATVCFAISKWLARFLQRNFHYHDYNHTTRETELILLLFKRLGVLV